MKTRIVYPNMWLDKAFVQTSLQTKVLFGYLTNNQHLGLSRFTHISDRQIAFDTNLSDEDLETSKKELENIGWCYFHQDWIFHNHDAAYIDYQGRDRVMDSKRREISKVPTKIKEVIKGLIAGYEKYDYSEYFNSEHSIPTTVDSRVKSKGLEHIKQNLEMKGLYGRKKG